MRKKLTFLVFALVFFCAHSVAFADTCTLHGGPNCSIGPNPADGSIVCNDGSSPNSLDSYYGTYECIRPLHFCSQSEFKVFTNKYNLQILGPQAYVADQARMAALEQCVKDGNSIDSCAQSKTEKIQQVQTAFKIAAARYGAASAKAHADCYALGAQEYAESMPAKPKAPDQTEVCAQKLGSHGIVVGQNSCGCSDSYVLNSNQTACVPAPTPSQSKATAEDVGNRNLDIFSKNPDYQKSATPTVKTKDTATTTQTAPPKKSLWQKFLGWFKRK